jgi:hypothetical protein
MKNRLLEYGFILPDAPTKPAPKKQNGYKPKKSGKDRILICRYNCYYPGTRVRNGGGHTLTTDGKGNYRVNGEATGPAGALRAYIIWSNCPEREAVYVDRMMLRDLANQYLMPLETAEAGN